MSQTCKKQKPDCYPEFNNFKKIKNPNTFFYAFSQILTFLVFLAEPHK